MIADDPTATISVNCRTRHAEYRRMLGYEYSGSSLQGFGYLCILLLMLRNMSKLRVREAKQGSKEIAHVGKYTAT
jgi:hypothetical protein